MILDDVIQMEDLMQQLGYPTSIEQLVKRFQKLLHIPNYQSFVADIEGKIVGFVGLAKQAAYEFDDDYVRVLALVVHEDYRNLKIGQQLMQTAETFAVDQHCVAVTLNSGNREERVAAHKFYKHLGYEGKSTGFTKRIHPKSVTS